MRFIVFTCQINIDKPSDSKFQWCKWFFLVRSVLEASEIATVDGFLAEEDQRSRHGHKRSSGSRDPHPDK
jgi:hypothetical protein